jgi:hypothetical protein
MADAHPGATISIESKDGKMLNTFKESVELDEVIGEGSGTDSKGKDNVHDLSPPTHSKNKNISLCGWNNAVCPDEKIAMDMDTRSKEQKQMEKDMLKGKSKCVDCEKKLKENAPINSAGTGSAIKGLDDEPPVKKKRKKFAGCEVFELQPEEYDKCVYGRTKYERWSKKVNMEDMNNQEMKSYHHKNPGKSIVIQNSKTGHMTYFVKSALN